MSISQQSNRVMRPTFADIRWYLDLFASASPSTQVVVEKSPGYLVSRESITKVKEFYPGMRIIFSLKDPLFRAVSDFVHEMEQAKGKERWGKEAKFEEVKRKKKVKMRIGG